MMQPPPPALLLLPPPPPASAPPSIMQCAAIRTPAIVAVRSTSSVFSNSVLVGSASRKSCGLVGLGGVSRFEVCLLMLNASYQQQQRFQRPTQPQPNAHTQPQPHTHTPPQSFNPNPPLSPRSPHSGMRHPCARTAACGA